jgi:arsenate reductase
MAKKAQILYLCSGNSVLALMAEGFTRYYGGLGIGVSSVVKGTKDIHPYCSWAMNETGIDIADIKLQSENPKDMSSYTHIISLDSAEGTANTAKQESWGLPYPDKVRGRPEEVILAFRSVRNQIEIKVKDLLTQIFEK